MEAIADNLCRVPESAGIYVIFDSAEQRALYAGEALILRNRLRQHIEGDAREIWKKWAAHLTVQYYTAASEIPVLLAYQWLYVRKHEPLLNLTEPVLT